MMSPFSRPPMRCSRPATCRGAHGRARVSLVAGVGWNVGVVPAVVRGAGAWANRVDDGQVVDLGIRHGSEPLARQPSESSITGVR